MRVGRARSSPCVPVAISSEAASKIATASVTVTRPTGVFISGRAVSTARCRAKVPTGKMLTEKIPNYVAIVIAKVILLESTVSVTTRHSVSAPIASEAAIAWVNRDDATGAGRPWKPAVPDDRIMV